MPVCTEDLDVAIVKVTGTFDGVEEISAELREGIVLAKRVYNFVMCAARVSREDRKRTAISLWS